MHEVRFVGGVKDGQAINVRFLSTRYDIPATFAPGLYSLTPGVSMSLPISSETYYLETVRDYVQMVHLQTLEPKDTYFYVHESIQDKGGAAVDAFNTDKYARTMFPKDIAGWSMNKVTVIAFIGGCLDGKERSLSSLEDEILEESIVMQEEQYFLLIEDDRYTVRFYLSSKEVRLVGDKEKLNKARKPWLKPSETR